MTAKTSAKLARALTSVGLSGLAWRARRDEFHDYLSNDHTSSLSLNTSLCDARDTCPDSALRQRIERLRQRFLDGKYDASKEERDEWAASPGRMKQRTTFGCIQALEVAGGAVALASKIGISPTTVSLWTAVPKSKMAAVSKATGIPVDELRLVNAPDRMPRRRGHQQYGYTERQAMKGPAGRKPSAN
jgi:DNA-binding transcriptional regulator YdaS (Cro superfamily)